MFILSIALFRIFNTKRRELKSLNMYTYLYNTNECVRICDMHSRKAEKAGRSGEGADQSLGRPIFRLMFTRVIDTSGEFTISGSYIGDPG